MRYTNRVFVFCFFLTTLAAFAVGAYFSKSDNFSPPSNYSEFDVFDGIAVLKNDLDVGLIKEQNEFEHKINIHNFTSEPIAISRFRSSCDCSKITPSQLVIPPHDKRPVLIKIKLPGQNLKQSSFGRRSINVSIVPAIQTENGLMENHPWQIQGIVLDRIQCDRDVIQFTNDLFYGEKPLPQLVTVKLLEAQNQLRGELDKSNCTCVISKKEKKETKENSPHDEMSKGEVLQILVTPQSDLPPGAFENTLRLQEIRQDGSIGSQKELPILGTVRSEVWPIPSELSFGLQKIGVRIRDTLSLAISSDSEWIIDKIQTTDNSIKVEELRQDRAGKPYLALEVSWVARNEAIQKASIRITVKSKMGKKIELEVPATIQGFGTVTKE